MSAATIIVIVCVVLCSAIVAVGMWVAPREDRDDGFEDDEES